MIYSWLIAPGAAALLATALFSYAVALTLRHETWRFAGAIILSLTSFVVTAIPTCLCAVTMTDECLRTAFATPGVDRRVKIPEGIYVVKTFEEFRRLTVTASGSNLQIASVAGVLIAVVAFIFIRNEKRRIGITRRSEVPK